MKVNAPSYVALVGGAAVPELGTALARRGLRGALLSSEDRLAGRSSDAVVDVLEGVDFRRPLAVLRRIVELHHTLRFRGIVGAGEFGLLPAALAAERLGLPGPSSRAVINTREKTKMRRLLERQGLGQVRWAECRSAAAVGEFQGTVRGPVIVKPAAGTGSAGVCRIDSPGEAASAFALASGSDGGAGVLCEEFVDGPEVSVEGVTVDGVFHGVAVTDKRTDAHYLETGHDQPSSQPAAVRDRAFALASRVTAALGLRHGVSHTEMRITPKGPILIETHTRMGGDRIPVLTHLTTGVDLADLMVGLAVGETPFVGTRATGRAASIRFLVGQKGRVGSVSVPEALPTGVEEASVSVKPGDFVSGRSSSLDRLGHVLASGEDAAESSRTADAFLGRIRVAYSEPEGEVTWRNRAAS